MNKFGRKIRLRYNDAPGGLGSYSDDSDDIDNNSSTSNSFESDESEERNSSYSSTSSSESDSDSSKEAKPRRPFGWVRKKARESTDDNATTFSIQSSLSRVSESVQSMIETLDDKFDTFVDSMIADESDSDSDDSNERGPSFVKKIKDKIMSPLEVHKKMTTLATTPKHRKGPGENLPSFQFAKNRSPSKANKPDKGEPSTRGTKPLFPQLSTFNTPKSTRSSASMRSASNKHVPFSTRSTNKRRPHSNRSLPRTTKSSSLGRTFMMPSSTRSYQRQPEKRFTFDEFVPTPEHTQNTSKTESSFFSKGFNTGFFGFQESEGKDEISAEDPFDDLDSLATPPETQGAFWNEIMSFMHDDKVPTEITFQGVTPEKNKKCFSFQRGRKNKYRKNFSYTSLG